MDTEGWSYLDITIDHRRFDKANNDSSRETYTKRIHTHTYNIYNTDNRLAKTDHRIWCGTVWKKGHCLTRWLSDRLFATGTSPNSDLTYDFTGNTSKKLSVEIVEINRNHGHWVLAISLVEVVYAHSEPQVTTEKKTTPRWTTRPSNR